MTMFAVDFMSTIKGPVRDALSSSTMLMSPMWNLFEMFEYDVDVRLKVINTMDIFVY